MVRIRATRTDSLNSRAVAARKPSELSGGPGFPGALCAQMGPELFFVEEGSKVSDDDRMARALCFRCPARLNCLLFAIDHPGDSHYGVWGGLLERNLRWLKHQPIHGPERPPVEERN